MSTEPSKAGPGGTIARLNRKFPFPRQSLPRDFDRRAFLHSLDPLQTSDCPRKSAIMLTRIKSWAKALKRDVVALWIAARSPRTPIAAKLVAGAVAAYALSPIDLIPDSIPVVGYLDDLVIVPLGIALAVRLIPAALMAEFRAEAVAVAKPINRAMAVAIVFIWVVLIGIAAV